MSSASSSETTPRTASPASSVEMGKPAVLLIGNITHVKKEWEECGSFAELKAWILLRYAISPADFGQTFNGKTREEFLKACEDGSYSDVVAINRSNESTAVSASSQARRKH